MSYEENEKVRKQLDKYIRKFGVKKIHIARQVGLSGTTIGLFLDGQRELALSTLEEIQELMREKM